MNIKSIRLQNFMSYRDSTLKVEGQGTVLVVARVLDSAMANSNGGGKSTLIPDSLLFALSGRTLRGRKGARIVNKTAGKDCLVTVCGDVNGAPFVIRRPQSHTEYSQPELDYKGQTFRGDAQVSEIIQREIMGGVSITTFIASQIFGKGKNSLFFTQLDDSQRKVILDEILGFTVLSDLQEQVKKELAELNLECAVLEPEITGVSREIISLEESYADSRGRLRSISTECGKSNKLTIKEAKKIEQAIKELDRDVEDVLRPMLVNIQGVLSVEKAKYANITQEHKVNKQKTIDEEIQLRVLLKSSEKLTTKIKELNNLTKDVVCDDCGNTITEDSVGVLIHQVTKELDLVKANVSIQSATFHKTQKKEDKVLKERKSLEQVIEDLVEKYNVIHTNIATKTSAIKDLQHQLSSLEQRTETNTRLLEQYTIAVDDLKNRILSKQLTLTSLKGKLNCLQPRKNLLEELEESFGNRGIKSSLFRGAIPKLNEFANMFCGILTNQEMAIVFKSTTELASGELREKISLTIIINGEEMTYDECSEGQKRRADIVTTLALGELARLRVGFPINFMVLDEIFDGLDELGLESVMKLLQSFSKDGKNIFVITHDNKLENYFSKSIVIEYSNKVSTLVG